MGYEVRRQDERVTGIPKNDGQKPPIWDFVGLVLVNDRRLLIVVPVFAAICYLASKVFN